MQLMIGDAVRLAAAAAALLALTGCIPLGSGDVRRPVPLAFAETAQVAGYPGIRAWGDEYTAGFEAAIVAKDIQVRDAALTGRAPLGIHQADFLSISGGGDQGAFAAGLLAGWTKRGTRPVFEVVTGVSAGALAAPFAFLGPSYDNALKEIYTEVGAEDLYASRGVLGFFDDAINDTAPLEKLIRRYATEDFLDRIAVAYRDGRRVLVLTTNIDAERPVVWDLSGIAASGRPDRLDLCVKVLLASSAIPGVFPPVTIPVVTSDGHTYEELHVDGGVTAQMVFVPLDMKPRKIEDRIFGAMRARTLYVIRNGKLAPEYAGVERKALSLASRAVATLVKYQVVSDLQALSRTSSADKTDLRFAAVPSDFDESTSAPFDRAAELKLYGAGFEFGRNGLWSSLPSASPQAAATRIGPSDGSPEEKQTSSSGQ